MRCPTLDQLPPPPPGKTGWPWTEESPQLPDTMPDGRPWPRISIVTPSYNQGQFIEETIRSVLLQGYPNLEYIVIDGGSTDGSVEIIRRYEPWLAYWVSEKDRGQSHAINKGFARSTGEIMAWLNSDDVYVQRALETVARECANKRNGLIWGICENIDATSRTIGQVDKHGYSKCAISLGLGTLPQPATFWHRTVWEKVGGLSESLFFSMDYDLWMRFATQPEVVFQGLSQVLAAERIHPEQKTSPRNRSAMSAEMASLFRARYPSLLHAWRYVLKRRKHLKSRGRGWYQLLTDLTFERAVFRDGMKATRNGASLRVQTRFGFLASYVLIQIYLFIARKAFFFLQ